MARIEKTVFISYRRKDISWALAVYQYLTSQKYDVFFDFSSIPSGDFEQIILSNIRARAHFILILTPATLDRCSQPGDWVRREIETAIAEKRNIVPLFFDDFNFGSPSVAEKLTGPLADLSRYNGLNIPSGYFMEAMERMRSRYLNVPLEAVLHPISREVQEVVKKEQTAADTAVLKRKAVEEKIKSQKQRRIFSPTTKPFYFIGALIFAVLILGIFGVNYLFQSIATDEMPTPTITSVPTLEIGSTMVSPKDGMVLVYVPAGHFEMGSDDPELNAQPVHKVRIDSFWIDQTEVTNAMFSEFVKESGYITNAEKTGTSNVLDKNYEWQKLKGADWAHPLGKYSNISKIMDHPVVHISWNDAQAYCTWTGRRLPTEAEWEKAADWDDMEQQKLVYPWGNSINCSMANYWGEGNGCVRTTAPVGSYETAKSPYGTLDMAGNVSEWVNSLFRPYPYNASDGREDPNVSGQRVLRGGAWNNAYIFARSPSRGWLDPMNSDYSIGFRCARDE